MAKKDKQHNKEIKDLLNALNKSVGEVVNGHVGQVLLINETNQRVAFFGAEMSATLQNIFKAMQNQTDFMTREAAEAEFRADVAKKGGIQPIEVTVEGDEKAVEAAEGEKKKTKGFLSKIGGMFAGAGMGAAGAIAAVGIAAAGIALVVMSITKLIEVMSNLDAGMIKDKVVTLLSIAGEVEKDGKSFIGEGAKFFLAMVGIGLGLLVFGLGAGVAGLTIRLVQAGFAEKVVHIVTTLMQIPAALGGNEAALAGGGVFLAVMLGIGLGLLVFGIGQAVASLTIRLAQEGFAEKVLQIVTKLMEIPAALGGNVAALAGGGTFLAVMIGIGLGLLVFGTGLAVSALVLKLVNDDFAGKVLQIVTKLMEVPAALGGPEQALKDAGTFGLVMLALGAGLLVFGAGLGLAVLVTSLAQDNFAENVVHIVTTLLSINNLFSGVGDVLLQGGTFILTMLGIAAGLYIFSAGTLAASLVTLVSGNFADKVVQTVMTLLGIKDQLGGAKEAFGEVGSFLLIMAGIAAGLLVFSIGEAAAGIASFIGGAGTGGKGIAQDIADKVGILMQVAKDTDETAVDKLKLVLGKMREAISAFTGNIFQAGSEGLKNLLTSGGPLDAILEFARSAEGLEKGITALERLTDAVIGFGQALSGVGASGRNSNLQIFSDNLDAISSTIRASLDEMIVGGGMGRSRTQALEALAAVNVGSEGFAAMRDANAAATPPSVTNNITNAMSNTGGTTNIFNDAGSIDRSLLEQAMIAGQ